LKRVCITGGAGFIGSNLADRLRSDGVEVAIVDDFRTGRHEFVQQLEADPGLTPALEWFDAHPSVLEQEAAVQ
jgi:nucleoside-diphosphate-sugar epimerase